MSPPGNSRDSVSRTYGQSNFERPSKMVSRKLTQTYLINCHSDRREESHVTNVVEKILHAMPVGFHSPAETLRVACFPAGVRRWYRVSLRILFQYIVVLN
jgi:hypothetical protein